MIRPTVFLLFASLLVRFSQEAPAAPPDPPAKGDAKRADGFAGRTKEGKSRLLKEFGGSAEGEEAVMLGLAWLTQMQKPEGNWVYDAPGFFAQDHAAATGMAILAFLGAGQSHKEGRYKQTVQAGVDWLANNVETDQGGNRGKFKTISTMYSQGIATLALVEAYGMTHDPKLKQAAQAAIDYIQKGQGPNGSWGYDAGSAGDTSIVGWQLQALHAAMLTQDLVVDDKVIKKAIAFLNYVSTGQTKAVYGYNDPGQALDGVARAATSLSAIGLLCRYYVDGWRSEHAGFAEGSKGLMKGAVAGRSGGTLTNLYYFYYATQVVRFYGGEEWKTWNEGPPGSDGKRKGGLSDWLLSLQDRTSTHRGSWAPEEDALGRIGQCCGRLGTTCMCLLTLQVYYRYAPEDKNPQKK